MLEHPNEVFRELRRQTEQIADEQRELADQLDRANDGKHWFAKVYHHVTTFETRMIDAGRFKYPIMKMQEVAAFHETYRQNMDAWRNGHLARVEPNWRHAFEAAERAA